MKRLIVLILLLTVLVACSSTKEIDKEVKEDSSVKETELEKDKEEKDEVKEADNKETKNESAKKTEDKTTEDKKEPEKKSAEKSSENQTKKPSKKSSEKSEKEEAVKNEKEKIEVAAENIIWAQNNRDYVTLKNYLGQNITLNEEKKTLKITNVDYPHEAKLLKEIKQADLEYRFTDDGGQDHIVGFAVTDYEKEMSYTIDLTMRVGKDNWKMLNMQINK